MSEKQQWETKVEMADAAKLVGDINREGLNGWEPWHMDMTRAGYVVYFKRKINK